MCLRRVGRQGSQGYGGRGSMGRPGLPSIVGLAPAYMAAYSFEFSRVLEGAVRSREKQMFFYRTPAPDLLQEEVPPCRREFKACL